MVKDSPPGRPGLVGHIVALLLPGLLGACSSWLPNSATQDNHTLLYGEFYKANFGNDATRADALASRLELCGRQLYLKDKGFFTALRQQEEHGSETSLAEIVDLFTEDACEVPDSASSLRAGEGFRRGAPGAGARGSIDAGHSD